MYQASNATPPTKVLLIDDHGMCRNGLAELLQRRTGMEIIGKVGSADEALACVQERAPDLIISDLRMPAMDGIQLITLLREQGCETSVVILTMSDAQEDLAMAVKLKVRGYLLKDMEPDDIVRSIGRIARGETVIAPEMVAKLTQLLQNRDEHPPTKQEKLTKREREVLRHIAAGESNKTIARALNISHDTVKLHVRHILAKLGLSSRVEAAVFAVENGRA